MLTNPKATLVFLILIVTVFIYGLVQLLSLRFESGDAYPAYSSLRSDPLGTRALFDGLDKLAPSTVRRNYLPLSQLNYKEPTTLLYLGSDHHSSKFLTKEFSAAVDRITAAGGRLVMSFRPVHRMYRKKASDGQPEACREEINRPTDSESKRESDQFPTQETGADGTASQKQQGQQLDDQPDDCLMHDCQMIAIDEHWGVSFNFDRTQQKQSYAVVESDPESNSLPHEVTWHTELIFEKLDSLWKVLYSRDGHPVIIERPFGSGTILLVADSYLFSNEALRKERHPALLARFIGSNSQIVFDEGHFGIYKIPGIAGLIRTHGLHGFFCGLALIFVLFVWKNSSHFVPPLNDIRDETEAEGNQGRDVFQGLVSLLRRNISTKDILKVGMDEWKKSFDVEERLRSAQLAEIIGVMEMEPTVSENKVDPVKGYIKICRILSEGKKNE